MVHDTYRHDVCRYEQMSVFAVVIPPLDYLRDTLGGHGVEVASLDSAGLCALKEAVNLVSALASIFKIVNLKNEVGIQVKSIETRGMTVLQHSFMM